MGGPADPAAAVRAVVERSALPPGAVVHPFRPRTGTLPAEVALFDVRWPPPGPGRDRFRGAAVLGRPPAVLDLDDPAALGRLVTLLWAGEAAPAAEVVARYARRGPFDTVLGTPAWSTGPDGRPRLTFDSCRPAGEAEDGGTRLAVDRWTVTRESATTVAVQITALADGPPGRRAAPP